MARRKKVAGSLLLIDSPLLYEPFYYLISGGVDSMSCLHALLSLKERGIGASMRLVNFNHGTKYGGEVLPFLEAHARGSSLPLLIGEGRGGSNEKEWKDAREEYLSSLPLLENGKRIFVQAHHTNDALEWYIFSSLRRYRGEYMPLEVEREDGRIFYRPLMANTKEDIRAYAKTHSIPHIEDPSNADVSFHRNRIRHNIVSQAEIINPGLMRHLKRHYLEGRKTITLK